MKKIIIPLLFIFLFLTGFMVKSNDIDQKEKDAIIYIREEEKLARDVYEFMYNKWEVNPFGNIRYSEQIHMNRIKLLIDTYKLEDPVIKTKDIYGKFINVTLQKYYNELVEAGSQSLTAALKVGAKIEELDIADLEERIKQTQREDIVSSFEFLKMASHNHLRAFVRRLKMVGVNYTPVILSKVMFDQIIGTENSKGGYEKRDN